MSDLATLLAASPSRPHSPREGPSSPDYSAPPPPPEPLTSGALLRRHTTPLPAPLPPPVEQEQGDDDMVSRAAPPRPPAGRLSLSLSALPPLDFSALCPVESAPACAATARRNVLAITRSLSTVRPWLLVSGVEAAADGALLAQRGVTHVVNMAAATAADFHAPRLPYLSIAAADDPREDLSALLPDTIAAIDAARAERGGAALVHCHRGISRSVAVAAAYLTSAEGMGAEQAVAEVRRSRPIADPNDNFCAALAVFASRVRDGLPADELHALRPHGRGVSSRASPLVPVRVVGGVEVVDSGAVWIVSRRRRAGFVLVVGPGAGDAAAARGRELIARLRHQAERHEAMFPVATAGGGGSGDGGSGDGGSGDGGSGGGGSGGGAWRCPVEEIGRERWSSALAGRLAAVGSGGSWDDGVAPSCRAL